MSEDKEERKELSIRRPGDVFDLMEDTFEDFRRNWMMPYYPRVRGMRKAFDDLMSRSKTDLVDEEEVKKLSERIRGMNPRAPIKKVHFGNAPIAEVLDIRGFNLNAILELDPEFLVDSHHEHHDEVESFVFRSDKPFDGDKLEQFLSGIIQVYGPDLLRYKGVLWMKGNPQRVVFQGVHMMMGGDLGKPWGKGEKKQSTMVFIGKKLPRDLFVAGLEQCLAR